MFGTFFNSRWLRFPRLRREASLFAFFHRLSPYYFYTLIRYCLIILKYDRSYLTANMETACFFFQHELHGSVFQSTGTFYKNWFNIKHTTFIKHDTFHSFKVTLTVFIKNILLLFQLFPLYCCSQEFNLILFWLNYSKCTRF